MTFAIKVSHLTKVYKDFPVLEDINLDIEKGCITGLVGRNGAGKTTLLSIILGLTHPTSGEVFISDQANYQRNPGGIGFSLNQGLYPSLSAIQHLMLLEKLTNVAINKKQILSDLGLPLNSSKKIKNYSMGMQQRMRLAIALSGENDIVILDEPLNGLDPDGIAWFQDRIQAIRDEGGTVLISSHLLNELEVIAEQIVLIDVGILWQGSLEEVRQSTEAGSISALYGTFKRGARH